MSEHSNPQQMPRAYTENQRPPCPFYGFMACGMHGVLMDQQGNGCALMRGYSPCFIETERHNKPDWDECPYNTEEMRQSFIDAALQLRIFPQEFYPVNTEKWNGIPFREWLDFLNKIHGRNF